MGVFKVVESKGKAAVHQYEDIENIISENGFNELEDDFMMIAGMSPEEARQASINVGIYDLME